MQKSYFTLMCSQNMIEIDFKKSQSLCHNLNIKKYRIRKKLDKRIRGNREGIRENVTSRVNNYRKKSKK